MATRLRTPMVEKLPPPTVDLSQAEEPESARRSWPVFAAVGAVALLFVAAITYGLLHHGSGRPLETSSPPPGATAASSEGSSDPLPTRTANANGAVRDQVLPKPSQSAKNTIHGRIKVRVKVAVDPAGQVSSAKFIHPGPSRYFARLAIEAAQQWKFTAPTMDGTPVESEWNLLFEFVRDGTNAQAQKIKPSTSSN